MASVDDAHGPGSRRGLVTFGSRLKPAFRLFCCSYAGGSSAAFLPWRPLLPDEADLCAFELPGRGRRFGEAPLRSMSAVVHHVAALLDGRLDLPFAFYGHSMGAVTALEVARRLVAAGLPPSCLVVSGAAAPHLPSKREHALHQLPEAELIRELIRLEGLPAIAHQRDDYFETFLPTIRADIECRERWIAEVSDLAIPIYALGGVSDRMVTRSDLSDWKEYTSGPFELRQFAGGHFFINTTTREVVTYIAAAVAARCLSR